MKGRRLVGRLYRAASPLAPEARMARSHGRFMEAGGRAVRFSGLEGVSGTLFDLGGYRGDWSAYMLEHNPESRAFIFEPVDEYAERLRERFADDKRVRVFNFGLGATTRAETIRVAGESSSIYRHAPEDPAVRVQIVDVAEWWEQATPSAVAVMKINIEGGEYELLPRLIESRLIEHVECLDVQFHPFVPGATRRMATILHRLRRTHEPVWRYPFIWERWRRKAAERG